MSSIAAGYPLFPISLKLVDSNKLETGEAFALETSAKLDYAALRADALFRSPWQEKQAAITLHAQQIAQQTTGAALAAAREPQNLDNESGAVKAFLDYMAKAPEERYFEAFLKARGLSADDYGAMSPDEQQGLLKEFAETLKRRLGDATAERLARAARRAWL